MPTAIAADAQSNLYVVDATDNRVRKISSNGIITTVAGTGIAGFSGDGGPATQAELNGPTSIAVDGAGNLYIADRDNARVRRVAPGGTITTVAGNGNFVSSTASGDGGPATQAPMDPLVIAIGPGGTLYVADATNFRIRRIANGIVTTVAGTGQQAYTQAGAPAATSGIGFPTGLAVDSAGNVYFSEFGSERIRRINASGALDTVAGNGIDYHYRSAAQEENVPATSAQLEPEGLAIDSTGNIYVADHFNSRVRRIDHNTGLIATVVGTGTAGASGDNGPAASAQISLPTDIAFDGAGNLYIADSGNGRIRKVANTGIITTVAGVPLTSGGTGASIFLNAPDAVATDSAGNVYVADTGDNIIRRISPSGFATIVAGTGQTGFSGDGGSATNATLSAPTGVAVDASGNIYIADTGNYAIRRVDANGVITTLAGGPQQRGYSGDNGQSTSAFIGYVTSVAADNAGNIYFNDLTHYVIRKIAANGSISTFAGNTQAATTTPSALYNGDNLPATQTSLEPFDIAVDGGGNLYVADRTNNRIRRISAGGTVTTVAGNGSRGYGGDAGPAMNAQLAAPTGVAVDANGSVYIADAGNEVVRRISATGVITTIAGNGQPGFAGDNGPAALAGIDPYRIAVDRQGNVFVADRENDRVRKLSAVNASRLVISSGNNQSGVAGQTLANPLVVQVQDANGSPVAGLQVLFSVASGTATLNPSSVITGANGLAQTQVVLGSGTGPVTIVAYVNNLPSVTFTINSGAAGSTGAQIAANGIVSAGSGTGATFSPNSIVTLYGSNFTTNAALSASAGSVIPTQLNGVCVLVGGVNAPILYVQSGQINFIIPQGAPIGQQPVQVVSNCGQVGQQSSNTVTVTIQPAAPDFFYLQAQNATGQSPIIAVNAATGVLVGAPGLLPNVTLAPAHPGDILTIYATGLGATAGGAVAGQIPTAADVITGSIQMSIGGIPLAPTDILYAGVAPGYAGLYQINVRVPNSVPGGNDLVTLSVNGASAPSIGYLRVQ